MVPPPLICLIIKNVPIYQRLESWLLYMPRVGREGVYVLEPPSSSSYQARVFHTNFDVGKFFPILGGFCGEDEGLMGDD